MLDCSQMLQHDLTKWRLVFSVMEEGSVVRAAVKNGTDRPQLSRLIRQLENEIGRPLFTRRGRNIVATQFALEAKEKLLPLIEKFDDQLKWLVHKQDSLKGNIRLGAMPGFMQNEIVPLVVEFQKTYPDISFDVLSKEDPDVLMKGCSDVMFYYGPRPRKGLIEYWVTRSLFVACASPNYLREVGFPKAPADLVHHSGIVFTGTCRPHPEVLQLGTEEVHYRWKSKIRFNSILSAKTAAVNGAGVLLDCPAHHCFSEIVRGDLIPVLDGWHVPNLENYVGSTAEASSLKRVTTFIDWYIRRRREIESGMIRRLQSEFGVVVS